MCTFHSLSTRKLWKNVEFDKVEPKATSETTLNPQVMQDLARLRAVQSKREFIYNIALDIHINSDQAERCRAGGLHAHTPLCTVCHTSTHKCSELGNVKGSRDEFKVKLMMLRFIH